ncbi:hypothetical protein GCM10025868_03630 [Angustibacter aerolatus]|uniref:LuxR family transcriptional regulator n=1 Tax=Angustibacter aerolatus TaxID=1162965 RepID=A0ABQ6JCC5_9ACTN|nr:hypothetical protein GCM10025868_03630 [Angustibacter aerolatus]
MRRKVARTWATCVVAGVLVEGIRPPDDVRTLAAAMLSDGGVDVDGLPVEPWLPLLHLVCGDPARAETQARAVRPAAPGVLHPLLDGALAMAHGRAGDRGLAARYAEQVPPGHWLVPVVAAALATTA